MSPEDIIKELTCKQVHVQSSMHDHVVDSTEINDYGIRTIICRIIMGLVLIYYISICRTSCNRHHRTARYTDIQSMRYAISIL